MPDETLAGGAADCRLDSSLSAGSFYSAPTRRGPESRHVRQLRHPGAAALPPDEPTCVPARCRTGDVRRARGVGQQIRRLDPRETTPVLWPALRAVAGRALRSSDASHSCGLTEG